MLFISSPGYIPALLIGLFARVRRIRYVLDIRDLYPQVYADASLLNRYSLLYQCLWRLSRIVYRGASLITTVTHGLADEIATITPVSRIVCVYNGFPQDFYARKAIKHSRFTVCFHGVIGYMQDVKMMVGVAKVLHKNDIDFVVIGYGKYADKLRQCHSLRFYGQMPFDKTIAEVERCHIGLSLRVGGKISRDAFPVKIWEYIGLGIPSIVTPRCEAGDFLEKHGCGLQFTEGDVDGVCKAIIGLRKNSDALGVMASKCREVGAGHTREQAGIEVAKIVAQSISQPCKQKKISKIS